MKIAAYSLKELGGMYFPNSSARSGSLQLKRWIVINTRLSTALRESGYVNGQRYLTPRQVGLIFEYLGEP
ncbi:DUF4248 domain-containing protein [Parabacteroides johnsonii]|jgi:hypothetical protein|uniref:DUF4248 domain-containing protein n=2 Tax=Parabacteroides johnsonii TaxID=387661 RepID=A0AAW6I6J5_9BACT|nr:DUF4248 domain-containing protein [Parabacteroides johnsonii]MDC7150654.1 DUF4248 domain-containing protein [Parabacteroides johnsonii]MDC7159831.1 DUF4248 domain-containing protein [Parabacteroides johnsonii]